MSTTAVLVETLVLLDRPAQTELAKHQPARQQKQHAVIMNAGSGTMAVKEEQLIAEIQTVQTGKAVAATQTELAKLQSVHRKHHAMADRFADKLTMAAAAK
jgi:hypothetical protein